ncbi:hypothetical protein ACE6H2_023856 [Prunus campanulata]
MKAISKIFRQFKRSVGEQLQRFVAVISKMAKGGANKNHGPSSSRQSREIIEVDEKQLTGQEATPPVEEQAPFPPSGVLVNIFLILGYLFFGLLMFWKTGKTMVDGFYGSSVSLTSVGYGDLVAEKTEDKWSMSMLLLFGFFCVADRVEELYDLFYYQATMWLRRKEWYTDIWYINILFRVIGVTSVIGSGTLAIHFIESKGGIDALYLTVTSITTVGFGDLHFETTAGKCFATFWLLLSTIVARRLSKWGNTLYRSYRSDNLLTTRRQD